MSLRALLSTLALAATLAGALAGAPAGQALAQAGAPGGNQPLMDSAPLSLQSQLGAIPLVSPRALQQAAKVRTVRMTQLSDGREAMGESREVACPETGCQHPLTLQVSGQAMAFMADIQFVSHGAYLALQPRTIAVAGVVEFGKGRSGPVFLKGPPDRPLEQTLRFAAAPATVLRRLDAADDANTLAAGNIYTRKRSPDLILKVEIGPAQERKQE